VLSSLAVRGVLMLLAPHLVDHWSPSRDHHRQLKELHQDGSNVAATPPQIGGKRAKQHTQ
jgi:hypothetical protein